MTHRNLVVHKPCIIIETCIEYFSYRLKSIFSAKTSSRLDVNNAAKLSVYFKRDDKGSQGVNIQ